MSGAKPNQTQRAVIGQVIARVLWTAGASPSNRRLLTSAINLCLGERPLVMSADSLSYAKMRIKGAIARMLWTSTATQANMDLLVDAIYDELLAMPPLTIKLHPPERRILENLHAGKPWNVHLTGRSAHGGATGTLASLTRKGLLLNMNITEAGRVLVAPPATQEA